MPLRWTWLAVGLVLAAGIVAASPAQWQHEWPETDFSCSSSDLSEIISGGPPKDGTMREMDLDLLRESGERF